MPLKQRIFEIIERNSEKDIVSRIFNYFIVILIFLNVFAVVIESFQDINAKYLIYFNGFEIFSVVVFTLEYILRLWTADLKYVDTKHPHLKHIFSFMAIIDLLAILPFYLPLFFAFDLRFLRIMRLFRLLRILKLNRYSDSLNIIGRVVKSKKEILLTTGFIIFLLLLLASSLMYFIESEAQPDKFPNIIASMWWAVATLTTVGYGDIYPITPLGKFLSGVIAILGIGLVALPTGIISSGFINEINKKESKHKIKGLYYSRNRREKRRQRHRIAIMKKRKDLK